MALHLVVIISFLSQAGFSGSRVLVSLCCYAVFLSNAAMLAGGGWLMCKAEVPAARPN